ncbi:hypothetical protein TWF281_010780 [Arthrobotrys megalospora]
MFACFCTAEMVSPDLEDNAIPIHELQTTLDALPDTVRGHNPDYNLNYGGRTLRFTEPRRRVGSDALELFFQEEPDEGLTSDWFYKFRSTFGDRGPGGGSSSAKK